MSTPVADMTPLFACVAAAIRDALAERDAVTTRRPRGTKRGAAKEANDAPPRKRASPVNSPSSSTVYPWPRPGVRYVDGVYIDLDWLYTQGYLVIEGVLTPEECAAYRAGIGADTSANQALWDLRCRVARIMAAVYGVPETELVMGDDCSGSNCCISAGAHGCDAHIDIAQIPMHAAVNLVEVRTGNSNIVVYPRSHEYSAELLKRNGKLGSEDGYHVLSEEDKSLLAQGCALDCPIGRREGSMLVWLRETAHRHSTAPREDFYPVAETDDGVSAFPNRFVVRVCMEPRRGLSAADLQERRRRFAAEAPPSLVLSPLARRLAGYDD